MSDWVPPYRARHDSNEQKLGFLFDALARLGISRVDLQALLMRPDAEAAIAARIMDAALDGLRPRPAAPEKTPEVDPKTACK